MFVGGTGDKRAGRRSAGRAGCRAGLRTGWLAGPSMAYARTIRRTGLRSSQLAGENATNPLVVSVILNNIQLIELMFFQDNHFRKFNDWHGMDVKVEPSKC